MSINFISASALEKNDEKMMIWKETIKDIPFPMCSDTIAKGITCLCSLL